MGYQRKQFDRRKRGGRTPDLLRKSHAHNSIEDRIRDDHRWARRNRIADALETLEDYDDELSED